MADDEKTPQPPQDGRHVEPAVGIRTLVGDGERAVPPHGQRGQVGLHPLVTTGKDEHDVVLPLERGEGAVEDEVAHHDVVVDEDGDPGHGNSRQSYNERGRGHRMRRPW